MSLCESIPPLRSCLFSSTSLLFSPEEATNGDDIVEEDDEEDAEVDDVDEENDDEEDVEVDDVDEDDKDANVDEDEDALSLFLAASMYLLWASSAVL